MKGTSIPRAIVIPPLHVFSHSSGSDRWEPHPCPSARINSAQMMSWDMPYLGLFWGDGEAIEKIGNHQHHNHIEK